MVVPPLRLAGRSSRLRLGLAIILLVARGVGSVPPSQTQAASRDQVRIAVAAPTSLDPARQGDLQSAVVSAQLFESLTAVDPSLTLRPALAESWMTSDGGRRYTFTLRTGLSFSDGAPLRAGDVVRSWLRLLDPSQPSPLASLLDEVVGAADFRTGRLTDPAQVGISAPDDRTVEVRLMHPESDFPAIVAAPPFGVVPASIDGAFDFTKVPTSGGYTLAAVTASELTLRANDRYWAGTPAIQTVHLVTDLAGRSPVDVFNAGEVDYTAIAGSDATWIAYDKTLGPDLRSVPSFTVTYFGFDTSRAPFDDVRVRQAFAMAIDWHHLAAAAGGLDTAAADSMVPPGIPGRSDQGFLPAYDPATARQLLAEAGYPSGAGFPAITMITAGTGHEEAIIKELHDVLGIDVAYEAMDFSSYFTRLETDPPAIWSLSWVADYAGQNDFLGLLLGTDRTANYGRWSSPEFDATIARALEATDPSVASTAYADALRIVQHDAPVIPVEYPTSWALARDGLLGAGQSGTGIMRMAGLAWAP
jgi:oligopeptide transport system substrate-binding protein